MKDPARASKKPVVEKVVAKAPLLVDPVELDPEAVAA